MTESSPKDNNKPKRNRVSYKAETAKLYQLFMQLCDAWAQGTKDGTCKSPMPPDVKAWYDQQQADAKARADQLRGTALAKLSADERKALGL